MKRILACFALAVMLAACSSEPAAGPPSDGTNVVGTSALDLYDDNGNGRITCAEARQHGIAPVQRDHPAYSFMRDGDGDGVVCE